MAFVGDRLAYDRNEIAPRLRLLECFGLAMIVSSGRSSRCRTRSLICEFGQPHAEQRKRCVGAGVAWEIEPGDLWRYQVGVRRLLRSVQKLVAIDNLQDAVAAGAVAEVHAIAFRSG